MTTSSPKEKFGLVILLDALGASAFTSDQIKTFLSTRSEVNSIVKGLARQIPKEVKLGNPVIFTFGDTLVITIPITLKADVQKQITIAILLMRRYLFHSLLHKVLFRGAFSIGHYIVDPRSNTVMGEAVSDAAQWYERADWMGLSSTPKTNTEIEYHLGDEALDDFKYLFKYPVPMKSGAEMELYCISWPGAFFDKTIRKMTTEPSPRKWFLSLLKDLSYPATASAKYEHAKEFFLFVEQRMANPSLNTDAPPAGSAPVS